jgi:hypothetical protein
MEKNSIRGGGWQMEGVWGIVEQLLVTFLAVVGGLLVRDYLPSYLKRKAENLATKEDIEEITTKIAETEHEIRFEALHVKRAQVVEQMYKDIVAVEQALRSRATLLGTSGSSQSLLDRVIAVRRKVVPGDRHRARNDPGAALKAFTQDLEENRIYFYGDILKQLELLRTDVSTIVLILDQAEADEKFDQKSLGRLETAQAAIRENIGPAKRAIEDEFRVLLGVKGQGGA